MDSIRKNAISIGVLFLISDVASVAALAIFLPLLNRGYFEATEVHGHVIYLGEFLELLTALTVAGTGFMLHPVLKKAHEGLALGYAVLRAMEATMILVGLLSVLAVVALEKDFMVTGGSADVYQSIVVALIAIKNWTFLFGPNIILGINSTILGCLLIKSEAVPSIIGKIAMYDGPFIFVSAILVLFGLYSQSSLIQVVVALPMLIFEVWFSLRLITHGFNNTK